MYSNCSAHNSLSPISKYKVTKHWRPVSSFCSRRSAHSDVFLSEAGKAAWLTVLLRKGRNASTELKTKAGC